MKITENVFQLESTKRSHIFLILAEENILIDTGMPKPVKEILDELQGLGVAPKSIRTILLTHHDVDHIGNAKQLQEATGADVWAPEEDIPYITGERIRPGVKRVIGAIVRPQKPVIAGTYVTKKRFADVQALRAPGHTPGHTIFQYQGIVFTGDLFKFIDGRFRLFPGFMNWNQNEVKKSLSMLKKMEFEWLLPSHGGPVHNSPAAHDFLAQF